MTLNPFNLHQFVSDVSVLVTFVLTGYVSTIKNCKKVKIIFISLYISYIMKIRKDQYFLHQFLLNVSII